MNNWVFFLNHLEHFNSKQSSATGRGVHASNLHISDQLPVKKYSLHIPLFINPASVLNQFSTHLQTLHFHQKYCETVYSRSGINHMWILKNSKELLDNFKSRSFSEISSIKTFDFSTLYTTIPHVKLKNRLKEIIHNAFQHKNGSIRYKSITLGYHKAYFVNSDQQKGKT